MYIVHHYCIVSYCVDHSSLDDLRSILRESVLLKQCDHPNVLSVLGVVLETGHEGGLPFIVLPLMVNGDLKTFLKSKRQFGNDMDQLLEVCIDALKFIVVRSCTA